MEYASKAMAGTALGFGLAGTALGALEGAGGLAGLFGGRNNQPTDPGDKPVTRYEMGLYKEIGDKNDEIVLLKAEKYADAKGETLQAQITQQAVWTAGATATMGFMGQQIQQLFGITKLVVPNSSVAPGWGPSMVSPIPIPAQPETTVQTPTTSGT